MARVSGVTSFVMEVAMRRHVAAIVVGFVLVGLARAARADATLAEWVGTYDMNHDGMTGQLKIGQTKADCASPAWCALSLSYVDANGATLAGTIVTVDQAFQHMRFAIAFPGNRQLFDAYLMSWDKTRMAGTTTWQGRTFGFYAVKRSVASTPAIGALRGATTAIAGTRGATAVAGRGSVIRPEVVTPVPGLATPGTATTMPAGSSGATPSGRHRINANGEVETPMSDGSTLLTVPGQCGGGIILPDGTRKPAECMRMEVQISTPPVPDDATNQWLTAHDDDLLTVVKTLLGGDETSVDNYLHVHEPPGTSIYDQIRLRTELIRLLTD
jgi:hypothetical protein